MKKIKLAEEKEKNQERRAQGDTFQEVSEVPEFVLSAPFSLISRISFPDQDNKPTSLSVSVFQPPQV